MPIVWIGTFPKLDAIADPIAIGITRQQARQSIEIPIEKPLADIRTENVIKLAPVTLDTPSEADNRSNPHRQRGCDAQAKPNEKWFLPSHARHADIMGQVMKAPLQGEMPKSSEQPGF